MMDEATPEESAQAAILLDANIDEVIMKSLARLFHFTDYVGAPVTTTNPAQLQYSMLAALATQMQYSSDFKHALVATLNNGVHTTAATTETTYAVR